MQHSNEADLWARGEPVLNAWLSTGSPFVAEILAAQPFGSLTVDLQHGVAGDAALLSILQAVRASGVVPIVRVPGLDLPAINRALDLGALAIICPMIETVSQAQALAAATRYPPEGTRSFGPTRAAVIYGSDYPAKANTRVACLAMIETERAVDNLDAIAAVDGLDGLYIGPSDLAFSLGKGALPPGFDREEPALLDAILCIRDAAHRNGKRVGLHCGSVAYAARALRSGFDLVTLPNDVRLLATAASATLAELRETTDAAQPLRVTPTLIASANAAP